MRVNRSKFSQLKQQFDIMKMKSAYILAEKDIMNNPSLTGFDDAVEEVTRIWTMGEFGEMVQVSPIELKMNEIEEKVKKMQDKRDKLLQEEKYELIGEIDELINIEIKRLAELRTRR